MEGKILRAAEVPDPDNFRLWDPDLFFLDNKY
jgi:hypothetical protein